MLQARSYTITADDTEVIPVVNGDIISATTTLFAIYWTYGFDYPRKIQRTFAFLETYVFQLGKSKTFCLPALRLKTDVDSMQIATDFVDDLRLLAALHHGSHTSLETRKIPEFVFLRSWKSPDFDHFFCMINNCLFFCDNVIIKNLLRMYIIVYTNYQLGKQ